MTILATQLNTPFTPSKATFAVKVVNGLAFL